MGTPRSRRCYRHPARTHGHACTPTRPPTLRPQVYILISGSITLQAVPQPASAHPPATSTSAPSGQHATPAASLGPAPYPQPPITLACLGVGESFTADHALHALRERVAAAHRESAAAAAAAAATAAAATDAAASAGPQPGSPHATGACAYACVCTAKHMCVRSWYHSSVASAALIQPAVPHSLTCTESHKTHDTELASCLHTLLDRWTAPPSLPHLHSATPTQRPTYAQPTPRSKAHVQARARAIFAAGQRT